jgi:hypothetical protein
VSTANERRPRKERRIEVLSITLLSIAGVATSWSSYQAARWGGVQATDYSRASALRLESTRASAAADQQRSIDLATFMSWIEAYVDDNERLTTFYEQRFRGEFKPAFAAWLASKPVLNPDAAPTPFQLAEYRLAKQAEAEALTTEAEQVFTAGQKANERSDAYVLNAVLLASVLFFSGIAQQFRVLRLQFVLLGIASVLLAVGTYNVIMFPKLL